MQLRSIENAENISDEAFSLRFHNARLHQAWVVRKPGPGGTHTNLELFDTKGKVIAIVGGVVDAHGVEDPRWLELLLCAFVLSRDKSTIMLGWSQFEGEA